MFSSKPKLTAEQQQQAIDKLHSLLSNDVHTDLVKGGEEGLNEATLRRWLVARKWDVEHAATDLTAHSKWRADFVPNGRISEEAVALEIAQQKVFVQGCDRQGRPVTVLIVNKHLPAKSTADQNRAYIAYSLDCLIRLGQLRNNTSGKVVGVFDLQGFGSSNYDFTGLKSVFDMLQNHFPERLGVLYLYCAPTLFWALWKLVAPFIDPVTKEKVKFVYEKDAAEEFSKVFDLALMPPELGGSGQLVAVEQAWQQVLEEEEQQRQQQQQQAKLAGVVPGAVEVAAVAAGVMAH